MEMQYVRTDKNGTKIYHDYTCARCGGAGRADKWKLTGSTCYDCGGSGKRSTPKIVKVYAPEHRAKLDAAARVRAEKKLAEENATFFKRNGFAEDGTGYVFTGNTYTIREELKQNGARFNNWLHWISPHPVNDYPCVPVNAADICILEGRYRLDYDKCFAFKEAIQNADADRYISIPVYSEERNEDGSYDIIGYRKEYLD